MKVQNQICGAAGDQLISKFSVNLIEDGDEVNNLSKTVLL